MAKLSMQRVNIYALKKNQKKVLRKIQELGVVQVEDICCGINGSKKESEVDVFSQKEEILKSIKLLRDGTKAIKEAISTIRGELPASKKSVTLNPESPFYEPVKITENEFETLVDKSDDVIKLSYDVISYSKEITQKKSYISKLNLEYETVLQWKNLDIPSSFTGTRKTSCFIGTLPDNKYTSAGDILNKFSKTLNGAEKCLYLEIINRIPGQVFVFFVCLKKDADLILKELLALGFVACKHKNEVTPSERLRELSSEIEKAKKEIEVLKSKIKNEEKNLRDLEFVYDYYTVKCENYDIISRLYNTNKVFMLSGYVPVKDAQKLRSALHNFKDIFFEFLNTNDTENEPVLLKNPKVCAAVEPVLESYSLPSKPERDPTSIMAIFYYFLFGMMLSDAGYGAIISLICGGILLKFKNVKESFKKSLVLFLVCGISTMFWGVMFGSFFGDAIEVVSGTFFSHKIMTPTLWFMPIKNPMLMLSFSFAVGIVHMFTGLFMKLFGLIRLKKYKEAVCDVISWIMLVLGLIIYLLSVPIVPKLLNINVSVGSGVANASKICMAIGALIILLTSGRGTKNVFKRFLKGLYGLYGVTNYLSDIISYSRLLALGLSTGVIAQVFNKMGAMGGKSVFGVMLFVLVFLVGHTVNILINILGAYVHTNRLQFVEFFSKFYEGGGKKFSPFSFRTKYYKFFGGTQ